MLAPDSDYSCDATLRLCLSTIVYVIAFAVLRLYSHKQYNSHHYGRTYQRSAQGTGMKPGGFGSAHVCHPAVCGRLGVGAQGTPYEKHGATGNNAGGEHGVAFYRARRD